MSSSPIVKHPHDRHEDQSQNGIDVYKFKRSPPDSPSFDAPSALTGLFPYSSNAAAAAAASNHNASVGAGGNNSTQNMQQLSKSPFLLPAQFYKNLFASAAMLQQQQQQHHHHQQQKVGEKVCGASSGPQPFPRNLLFSCTQKLDVDEKSDAQVSCLMRRWCLSDAEMFVLMEKFRFFVGEMNQLLNDIECL